MLTIEYIVGVLREAVVNPDEISVAFRELWEFTFVEETEFDKLPEKTQDILIDLAANLDYFEPDPVARREVPSLFGFTRAVGLIEKALDQLGYEGTAK